VFTNDSVPLGTVDDPVRETFSFIIWTRFSFRHGGVICGVDSGKMSENIVIRTGVLFGPREMNI